MLTSAATYNHTAPCYDGGGYMKGSIHYHAPYMDIKKSLSFQRDRLLSFINWRISGALKRYYLTTTTSVGLAGGTVGIV